MSLISAGSISLDSTFKWRLWNISLQFWNPGLHNEKKSDSNATPKRITKNENFIRKQMESFTIWLPYFLFSNQRYFLCLPAPTSCSFFIFHTQLNFVGNCVIPIEPKTGNFVILKKGIVRKNDIIFENLSSFEKVAKDSAKFWMKVPETTS